MAFPFPILGLDLSGRTIRVAVAQHRGKKTLVQAYGSIAVGETGLPQAPSELAGVLKKTLTPSLRQYPKHVALALPDTQTFALTVTVQNSSDTDLAEAIRWEAGQHLPFDLSELILDWRIVAKEKNTVTAQVVAAASATIQNYLGALQECGLTPVTILPASIARIALATDLPETPAFLVAFDDTVTTISALNHRGVLFTTTTQAFCQMRLQQLLMEKLQLNQREAVKAQEVYGLDPNVTDTIVYQTLVPEIESLRVALEPLRTFFSDAEAEGTPSLLLCGAGTTIRMLAETLQAALGMQTAVLALPKTLRLHDHAPLTQELFGTYAAAISMSLA